MSTGNLMAPTGLQKTIAPPPQWVLDALRIDDNEVEAWCRMSYAPALVNPILVLTKSWGAICRRNFPWGKSVVTFSPSEITTPDTNPSWLFPERFDFRIIKGDEVLWRGGSIRKAEREQVHIVLDKLRSWCADR